MEGDGLEPLRFGALEIADLIGLVDAGRVSKRNARKIFGVLSDEGGQPVAIMAALGLESISDGARLQAVIGEVLANHPDQVARFRDGQRQLQGFFMGQVMRAMGGKADAREVSRLLIEMLRGE